MIGAIPFLLLPLLGGGLAYVFRRWRNVPFFIAVGISLLLGIGLLLIPFGQPITLFGQEFVLGGEAELLGRTLTFGPSVRAFMTFLFLTGSAFFFLAWQLEAERLFTPLGLGLLGLVSGVLIVRPLIYSALLLQIAATISVLPLQANPRTPVQAGLRYLTFFTLALPGLLISHWLLDLYAVTPDPPLLFMATVLIGFSFALLLGAIPFHPWIPTVGRYGDPLASAFLFSISGSVVWFLFLAYLQSYPWLTDYPQWTTALTTIGAATALVGGLLATARRGPGALMGYGVMIDTGLLLVALGQASRTGVALGIAALFSRAPGVALMAAGLTALQKRATGRAEGIKGLGLQAPWSTAALIVGALSLLGFPPTAGFAPRWGIYRLLFRTQPLTAFALLLASASAGVGLLRLLYELFTRPPQPRTEEEKKESPPIEPEPPGLTLVLALFILLVIGLGLFPQGLATAAAQVGAAFDLFGP